MSIVLRARVVSASLQVLGLRRMAAVTALGLLSGAGAAQADSHLEQTYAERAFVLAAHQRCDLFGESVTQALGAALMQTRGALLRAGYETAQVSALARQSHTRAGTTACADPALAQVTGRVENAFGLWARAVRINFPAHGEGWAVDRFRGANPGWRLAQTARVGASPVRFGLAGRSPDAVEPVAVVSFVGRSRPYAARIVMRDSAVVPRPLIGRGSVADVPPPSGRKQVFAARQAAAPNSLLAADRKQGEAWTFDAGALTAVEQLDPRETFWIEFLFRDDTVARVRMEVGDLTAARTFLAMGPVS